MRSGQPYQKPDLDSIEELNYISTYEEDAVIDAHIEELRQWGYGSITHANDLHQLFWEFTRRDIVLDKLFRVAVVECIDEEPLYTKFLGMAKRYNGWAQKQKNTAAKDQKDFKKELAEKTSTIEILQKNLQESQANVNKLKNEIVALRLDVKPKKEGELIGELRHELKKEYNARLQELRRKDKPSKLVCRAVLSELSTPCSRFFESFDLTKEEEVREYIEWFRLGGRKIKAQTQKIIADRYGEENIQLFMTLAAQYNAEWEATHQQDAEEDNQEEQSSH